MKASEADLARDGIDANENAASVPPAIPNIVKTLTCLVTGRHEVSSGLRDRRLLRGVTQKGREQSSLMKVGDYRKGGNGNGG